MVRSRLLRRYYKSAVLGWEKPKSFHWVKIVNNEGYWKWVRADRGIRGKLLRNPPIHLYQTVLGFRTNNPPRGYQTDGYVLGRSLLFDADVLEKGVPISFWKIVDCADMIQELLESIQDRGQYKVKRVIFSGFRGVHVVVEPAESMYEPVKIIPDKPNNWKLREYIRKRVYLARSIGNWCTGWDWKVTADPWRVARVPWSMHGSSALRAISISPPYTSKHLQQQIATASPFSKTRKIKVRVTRSIPLFTFLDGETYGPYHKGWATKIPIAVALHLIWQNLAKPRETGPQSSGGWFEKGWQILFRKVESSKNMAPAYNEGVGS